MKKVGSIFITLILILQTTTAVRASNEEVEVDLDHAPDYYSVERLEEEKEKYSKAKTYLDSKIVPFSGGSKTLNVTTRKQENDYYCGPAVAQMVIEFVSKKFITQTQLAKNMGTVRGSGTYVYRLAQELRAQTNKGYGYSHIESRSLQTPYLSNIDANLPVVFHVMTQTLNPNYRFDNGHYVLGIGYYWYAQGGTGNTSLTYIDPWYEPGFLGRKTISFSGMERAVRANAGFYIW